MKIVRYASESGPVLGRLDGQAITPFQGVADVQALLSNVVQASGAAVPLESVRLLAPIIPQRNVFCVGWNYLKHYDESKGKREGQEVELPERPTFFSKLPTTVVGPRDSVPLHEAYTAKLDWEVELAVVIGKEGRDIAEADALSHVFGYTVANDLSARDLQRAHGAQWFKGKSLDATCPMGPVLITVDEIGDPQNLALGCEVNGVRMQHGHTRNQIFSVARVIAELSQGLTLLPGDVILTGTPEGIGAARQPPVFLADGDVVECWVEGIGSLRNVVRAGLRYAE
ncbi:fumarylacetoacetate (FAA) hydrolase family protein 12 [Achromobacter xylosoxidans A8]|uniref:Fumarylacetoacetate (FAA) hydrolase family protein 12 n=1 Tax=Achromobacter xylosoxidans (strain A8) TaxID=762376 RepID=E3HUA0_ACHXA|nr:fumarylacetoacetate hydrolase family protein [Achromobacter xylosoxidans]ADP19810.1 fumarylacetoacetate (FAA) hydrolase family protein 12 [Achromobacter xylosoxidans A8]